MKNQTNKKLRIRSSLVLAMSLALWLPSLATAADEPMKPLKSGEGQMMINTNPEANPESAEGRMMSGISMMQHNQAMKEQQEKMMTDMKAMDTELTELVAKMNRAPEDKRLDMMAAIVTRMVEQRTVMNARMAKMQDEMMKHMQMSNESVTPGAMMNDMDGKSMDAHKEHNAEEK